MRSRRNPRSLEGDTLPTLPFADGGVRRPGSALDRAGHEPLDVVALQHEEQEEARDRHHDDASLGRPEVHRAHRLLANEANSPPGTVPGRPAGSRTWRKTPKVPDPSTSAASSSSRGTDSNEIRI